MTSYPASYVRNAVSNTLDYLMHDPAGQLATATAAYWTFAPKSFLYETGKHHAPDARSASKYLKLAAAAFAPVGLRYTFGENWHRKPLDMMADYVAKNEREKENIMAALDRENDKIRNSVSRDILWDVLDWSIGHDDRLLPKVSVGKEGNIPFDLSKYGFGNTVEIDVGSGLLNLYDKFHFTGRLPDTSEDIAWFIGLTALETVASATPSVTIGLGKELYEFCLKNRQAEA